MTITIYELMGLIKANKAPKKIKYSNKVYIRGWCDYMGDEPIGVLYGNEEDEQEFPIELCSLDTQIEIVEDKLKVKVIKSSRDTYWYTKYIGKKFVVKDTMACGYKVIEGIFKDSYIEYEDVEIIEENKKIEKIDLSVLNTQKDKNREFRRAINELIDEVENLKGKSE